MRLRKPRLAPEPVTVTTAECFANAAPLNDADIAVVLRVLGLLK